MRRSLRGFRLLLFWAIWPINYLYRQIGISARVAVICNNELLVVRDWISDGKWSLPGGRIKKGETAVNAALRELHEEVGINTKKDQLLYLGEIRGKRLAHLWRFQAFMLKTKEKPHDKRQRLELSDTRWLPVGELNTGNAGDDVLFTLKRCEQL
jgi:8-oxo-dGTP diphosphatase